MHPEAYARAPMTVPGRPVHARTGPFTFSTPEGLPGSPRGYRAGEHHEGMGDFLVIVAIVAFVGLMLALIRGLDRI
jgi:hypothetical protein